MEPFFKELAQILQVPEEAMEKLLNRLRETAMKLKDNPYIDMQFNESGQVTKLVLWSVLSRLRSYVGSERSAQFEQNCESLIAKSRLPFELLTEVEELDCMGVSLTELDVSKNHRLKKLSCGGNLFETLDLSMCLSLESLYCKNVHEDKESKPIRKILFTESGSQLRTVDLMSQDIRNFDASNLLHLEELMINTEVDSLKLPPAGTLKRLSVQGVCVSTLDLTAYVNLKDLSLSNDEMAEIDLSSFEKLEDLSLRMKNLRSLDLSPLKQLRVLFLTLGEHITDLDLSEIRQLRMLFVRSEFITELDIRANLSLSQLMVPSSVHILFEPVQAMFIEQLRGRVTLDKEVLKTLKLDSKAREYNWDDGVKGILTIIRNPRCDEATARYVYFMGQPLHFKKALQSEEKLDKEDIQIVKLLKEIEDKVHSRQMINIIPFNPHDYRGEVLLTDEISQSDLIPAYMKESLSGDLTVMH